MYICTYIFIVPLFLNENIQRMLISTSFFHLTLYIENYSIVVNMDIPHSLLQLQSITLCASTMVYSILCGHIRMFPFFCCYKQSHNEVLGIYLPFHIFATISVGQSPRIGIAESVGNFICNLLDLIVHVCNQAT